MRTSEQLHQDVLMAGNSRRLLNENPLWFVVERLARRITEESGGTQLGALADITAAAQDALRRQLMLDRTSGRSWSEIGQDLGVTPQAAQQRFGRRM